MSLQALDSNFMQGGAGMEDKLPAAIRELQKAGRAVVAGAAANTAIAVPGLLAGGTVRAVIMFAGGVPSLPAADPGNIDGYISATGFIKLNVNSTSNTLLVELLNK
jgi:hypothetical protein